MTGKSKIISVKTLREKTYETLDLGVYNELLGQLQSKFIMMCYGPSGSGKSVFALEFAESLSNLGKTLYNSHEEADNKTLQDRVFEFDINSRNLYFGISLDFEQMVEKIKRNRYHFVIIDSVQYMDFTYDQLIELKNLFKKKKKFGIVMVSFGNTIGKPDRGKELLHASDVKCFIKEGRLNVISRYLKSPVNKTLFCPKKDNRQLSLF